MAEVLDRAVRDQVHKLVLDRRQARAPMTDRNQARSVDDLRGLQECDLLRRRKQLPVKIDLGQTPRAPQRVRVPIGTKVADLLQRPGGISRAAVRQEKVESRNIRQPWSG